MLKPAGARVRVTGARSSDRSHLAFATSALSENYCRFYSKQQQPSTEEHEKLEATYILSVPFISSEHGDRLHAISSLCTRDVIRRCWRNKQAWRQILARGCCVQNRARGGLHRAFQMLYVHVDSAVSQCVVVVLPRPLGVSCSVLMNYYLSALLGETGAGVVRRRTMLQERYGARGGV